jgi:putative DNA primase/helicase
MSDHTEKFLDLLYGDREGFVALAFGAKPFRDDKGKYKHHGRHWSEKRYPWPEGRADILARVATVLALDTPVDIYLAPLLRNSDARRGHNPPKSVSNAMPPALLFADCDTPPDPNKLALLGPAILESGSPGHKHLIVPLTRPMPLVQWREVNLAFAGWIGGDHKWSDETLLRMPGTRNWKPATPPAGAEPQPPAPVTLHLDPNGEIPCVTWTPEDMADLLGVDLTPVEHKSKNAAQGAQPLEAPGAERPPDPLPALVVHALTKPPPNGDRSRGFAAVVGACRDKGFTLGQTLSVVATYPHLPERYHGRLEQQVLLVWSKPGTTPAARAKTNGHSPMNVTPLTRKSQPAPALAAVPEPPPAAVPVTERRQNRPEDPPAAPAPASEEKMHGQVLFAHRYARRYKGRFLHAHGLGWHEWDGARWARCLDGAEIRAVRDLVVTALANDLIDQATRKQRLASIKAVESANGIAGTLKIAGNLEGCTLAAQHLDAHPHLFNTLDGTVDLNTGEVNPPRPADHLSKVARSKFDPDARSEVFDAFLRKMIPDESLRAFLARSLGSSLLGRVRDHVLFIWHGTGANGKSTLRDAVLHAMGDYAIEFNAEVLLVTKYGPQAMSPERMRLKGTRAAFCSEIAEGAKLDMATMKNLTGGEPVNACLKYENPIQFDPSHTLFMLTNFLPVVRGDDPATWRRIMAVPFNVVVPLEEQDLDLPKKLRAESAAVMAFLWRGWLDYQAQGLNPPKAVLEATTKYQSDSDALSRFLADEEVVTLGAAQRVAPSKLFHAFQAWVRSQGEDLEVTATAFGKTLGRRGFEPGKDNRGSRIWRGIGLVSDARDEERGRA